MNKRVDPAVELGVPSAIDSQAQPAMDPQVPAQPDGLAPLTAAEPASGQKLPRARGRRKDGKEDAQGEEALEEALDAGEAAEGGAGAAAQGSDSSMLLAQAGAPAPTDAAQGGGAGGKGAAEGAAEGASSGTGAGTGAGAAAGAGTGMMAVGVAVAGLAVAGGGGGAAGAVAGIVAGGGLIAGAVADGYVAGAQLYVDANGNGIGDANELVGTTDANGNFSITTTLTGPLIATGGTNIDTGLPNTMVLKAPAGSTIVNPLTTLVQEQLETSGGTLADAQAKVLAALGLPTVDLTTYDPLAQGPTDPTALAIQKAAAQVAALIAIGSDDAAVIASLVALIDAGTPVDLTDTTDLNTLLGGILDPGEIAQIEALNDAIASATTLATSGPGSLSDIQEAYLNETDDAPVFLSGATGSFAETASSGAVVYTAQAVDAEGGTLTYSLGGADAAAFSIDPSSGVVTANSGADFETDPQSYQIEVTASDGVNATTQVVTIGLTNVNDNAPTIVSGEGAPEVSVFLAEDAAPGAALYQAAATDVDGDAISYSLGSTSLFSIDSGTGVVTLTGALDYEAQQSHVLTIYASDGTFQSEQTLVVNVNDVDEAPVFVSGASVDAILAENGEGGDYVYQADAADPEGASISYSLGGADAGLFSIDSSTGVVTANAPFDYESGISVYQVEVHASDGSLVSTQSLAIAIGDGNDAPQFSAPSVYAGAFSENHPQGSVIHGAMASDQDGDALSYSFAYGDTTAFSIDSSTGVVTLTGSLDYESDSQLVFGIYVSDGEATVTQEVTVDVTDVAIAWGSSAVADVDENVSAGTTVYTASVIADGEGVSLGAATWSLLADGEGAFAIDPSTGVVTLLQSPDYESGSQNGFTVQWTDGVETLTRDVTVNVNDLNEAPDFGPTYFSGAIDENTGSGTVVHVAQAIDPDAGDTLTYSLMGGSNIFEINPSTGELYLVTSADYEYQSEHNAYIRAVDSAGNETFQTFALSVNDVSEAPEYERLAATASLYENNTAGAYVYQASAWDPDGDELSYSISGEHASLFSIDATSGDIYANVAFDYESGPTSYTIEVQASDGTGATTQELTIYIDNGNDAPVFGVDAVNAGSYSENLAQGSLVHVATASDVDPWDSTLYYYLADGETAPFSINPTSGEVTLTGALDYAGSGDGQYVFTIGVSDDYSDRAYQTVTVGVIDETFQWVSGVTATAVDENVTVGTAVYTAEVSADSGTLGEATYSLVAGEGFLIDPSSGVVTLNFSPDAESSQWHEFTVRWTDGVNTLDREVVLAVNNLNDNAPTVTEFVSAFLDENFPIVQDPGQWWLPYFFHHVSNYAYDPDWSGGPIDENLTYSLVGGQDHFSITPNGQLTLNAVPDFESGGPNPLVAVIEVRDSADQTALTTYSLTINDLNEQPVFALGSNVTIGLDEEQAGAFYAPSVFDPDGGSLSYSIVSSSNSTAFSIDPSTGVVSANESFDYDAWERNYSLRIRATDAGGLSATQDVSIEIQPVNEAPIVVEPVAATTTVAINEGQSSGYIVQWLNAYDPEGQPVTWSIDNESAFSLVSVGSQQQQIITDFATDYRYDASNVYNVTLTVSDGTESSTRDFVVNVNPVAENIAPGSGSNFIGHNNTTGSVTPADEYIDFGLDASSDFIWVWDFNDTPPEDDPLPVIAADSGPYTFSDMTLFGGEVGGSFDAFIENGVIRLENFTGTAVAGDGGTVNTQGEWLEIARTLLENEEIAAFNFSGHGHVFMETTTAQFLWGMVLQYTVIDEIGLLPDPGNPTLQRLVIDGYYENLPPI